ncbi:MAG: S-adenosyl-l-methionine hydroxide adenosyltransferase [Microgenomates bacterium OLB23]|nr:MAG: S-adenosyl-l-methionine hydroxide adenosyltransferase [Microgenomates bacterium OLB23]
MKRLIVVGDYCHDTLVCQELRSAVTGFLKDPTNLQMSFVHSYPSTIHTSFLLNQVVQTEERYGVPRELLIFVNTDPRIAGEVGVAKAEGAKGVILKLASGVTVIGPNAGFCFSFVKSKIETLYTYDGLEKGSQFRSRDLYPPVIAYLMDYLDNEMDLSEADRAVVPEYRGMHVAHVDNYGNIKTTIRHSDLKGKYEYGDVVEVVIGGKKEKATYVDNLFGGGVGNLVIYPGSSGEPDDVYLEISAWSHFADSKSGMKPKTGKDFFPGVTPGEPIAL